MSVERIINAFRLHRFFSSFDAISRPLLIGRPMNILRINLYVYIVGYEKKKRKKTEAIRLCFQDDA